MPFTPFHWSIVAIGVLLPATFYLPAILISSVIMDIEPFYFLFISPSEDGILHGFFHTYIGAMLLSILTGCIIVKNRRFFDKLSSYLKIEQKKIGNGKIYFSSLFAGASHIFLDSFLYSDMRPFFPFFDGNPFLYLVSSYAIYSITGISLLLSLIIILLNYFRPIRINKTSPK